MTGQIERNATPADWARKPVRCLLWWVAPVTLAMLTDASTAGWRPSVLAWSAALAWMGLGCLLNARRCRRRHCALSWPILLAAAAILGLMVAGVVPHGSIGINAVLWGTFGLVLLSFVPEFVWGRYAGGSDIRHRGKNG